MGPEVRSIPMPEAWQRKRAANGSAPGGGGAPAVPSSFSPARRRTASPGAKRVLVPHKVTPRPSLAAGGLGPVLVPQLPAPAVGGWLRVWSILGDRRVMAVCGVVVALLLVFRHEGMTFFSRLRLGNQPTPAPAPAWHLFTAEEWFQQARGHAEEGDFRLALGAVRYALRASSPDDAELLDFEGDMHQSLFQFHEAQQSYEQVVRLDPQDAAAKQNLVLCRRLNRYQGAPENRPSTLYGLHRVMLGQHRVSEALAISQRLRSDQELQRATWQAALDNTGLRGKVAVGKDGALTVDLSGSPLRPDLSLLHGFPLTGLNLAGTGVEDVSALRGLPLERLDLSGTLVHDLAPLRDAPLRTLSIRGTGVVELSVLASCRQLRELDFSRTSVGDLSPLARLLLTVLRASNTPVADLRPLATLPLKELDLSRTRASDLTPLGNLGLETLALEETPVSDLRPLAGCTLQNLSLSGTRICDLAPLAGMPLARLSLARCDRVTDLRPLASCTDLEHLDVPSPAVDHAALAGLPHLRLMERK